MGSLRLQDTYRIDPNDLRSLPPGIAWVATGMGSLRLQDTYRIDPNESRGEGGPSPRAPPGAAQGETRLSDGGTRPRAPKRGGTGGGPGGR